MPTKKDNPIKTSSGFSLTAAWHSFTRSVGRMMDLREGMDREGTITAIKNGRKMQGANAWMP